METTRAGGGRQGMTGLWPVLVTGLVVWLATATARAVRGQDPSIPAVTRGETTVVTDSHPWSPDGRQVDSELPDGAPQLPFPLQFVPATALVPPAAETGNQDSPVANAADLESSSLTLTPRRSRAEDLPSPRGTHRTGPTSVPVMSSLCLVLGVFFAFVWLSRRSGRQRQGPPPEVLRHLGFFSLGHRRQVELVRFGGKLLILNTTPNSVEKIAELDDPSEVERLTADCLSPRSSRSHAAVRELIAGTRSTPQVTDSRGRPRYHVTASDAVSKK